MHIGVFGGSFDPPHLGHQTLVSAVLQQKLFDEVWYLPAALHDPQFTKPSLSKAVDRKAMLEVLVKEHQKKQEPVRLETIEIDNHLTGFTHSTLRALAGRHPEYNLSFVMGSDQLEKLHLWGCERDNRCFPKAFAEFDWYVYPRVGSPIRRLPFTQLRVVTGVKSMNISSTQVRAWIKAGQSVSDLLDSQVKQYIINHQLYH